MKKIVCFFMLAVVIVVLFPQCRQVPNEKKAKYVFYFIGDGMGVNQVNGTEMFLAEKEGSIGVFFPAHFFLFRIRNYFNLFFLENHL